LSQDPEKIARDPTAIAKLLDAATKKAKVQSERIAQVRSDFAQLMRMLGAYAKGEYKKIPWTSLVTGVLAVAYFVNPFDVIPDFIVGTGYLDDASVIAFCLNGLRKDLADFTKWEASSPEP
jgi:uncharacterized membrane protein YkvA (DUF1232 family)